ncbi:hypothetical protein BOTBODRAFT_631418 [Botryobasidium botryosum FD-172 SS1]|uniref:Uncharacterized protein n=1 Tax=Botryobasidium botryosum (strain FD-172 SS1) TaxID=930990 RepID=A0A067MND4_BOTB1|nr:hypothetical protein BOTBODRAFT_631418 [Botryobasidium botryosum FD-172 SS1]
MYVITALPVLGHMPIGLATGAVTLLALPLCPWIGRVYRSLTAPLLIILVFGVFFVVDTELMIRRNAGLVMAGESQWTFGHSLVMLLVAGPLIDLYGMGQRGSKGEGRRKSGPGEAHSAMLS